MQRQIETVLGKAIRLAERLEHIIVTTVGEGGMPHVTAAGKVSLQTEGQVAVTAWFCPVTVMNLQKNRAISIVIWDADADEGYQLLGEMKRIEDLAFMDGYMPEEIERPSPQIERKLVVRVDKILGFKHAPHNDIEAA